MDNKYRPELATMRMTALASPWNGRSEVGNRFKRTFNRLTDPSILVSLILTFDTGYHDSGWWKNSEYNQCLHASLTVVGYRKGTKLKMLSSPEKLTQKELEAWAKVIFLPTHEDAVRWLWQENGYKDKAITHLRLFYHPLSNKPFLPQGQVYNLVPYEDGSSPEKIYK